MKQSSKEVSSFTHKQGPLEVKSCKDKTGGVSTLQFISNSIAEGSGNGHEYHPHYQGLENRKGQLNLPLISITKQGLHKLNSKSTWSQ